MQNAKIELSPPSRRSAQETAGEGAVYHGFITWCGSDMSPDNDTRSPTTLKWDLEGFIGLRASTWKTGICTKTPHVCDWLHPSVVLMLWLILVHVC